MGEISTIARQLPDNLPDLAKFALIGREKLNAVRAEIRAIEKVGLAREVHEQKLQEAQEIAEAVLDAETKLGELTAKIPKATNGGANQFQAKSTAMQNKPKSEALSEIGIPQHTAERYETLAKHPQEVAEAKAKAKEENRIVTRQDVFNTIKAKRKTPTQANKEFIESVKKEHEAFASEKEGKTVNISAIKDDKEKRRILANDMWMKCMKMGSGISNTVFDCDSGEIDLHLMASNLPEDKIETLLLSIKKWINELTQIYEEIFND